MLAGGPSRKSAAHWLDEACKRELAGENGMVTRYLNMALNYDDDEHRRDPRNATLPRTENAK